MYAGIVAKTAAVKKTRRAPFWAWVDSPKIRVHQAEQVDKGTVVAVTGRDLYVQGLSRQMRKKLDVFLTPREVARIANYAMRRGMVTEGTDKAGRVMLKPVRKRGR
jgi:hypothetical protein